MGIETQRLRATARQDLVNSFLGEYGLLGVKPSQIAHRGTKRNIELAYTNARLMRRGFVPISQDEWKTFLQSWDNRVPKKLQLSLLQEYGFLRRPMYHI